MMVAVTYGHRDILKILLDAGLDPNKESMSSLSIHCLSVCVSFSFEGI